MAQPFLPRLVGVALLGIVVLMFAGGRAFRTWIGRPIPWGSWIEAANRESGGDMPGYGLYRGYVGVAGWFWLLAFALVLGGFGIYLLTTGHWL
jgi:hypothetical protein